MPSKGELAGIQIQPHKLAEMFYLQGWRDSELIIAVATCLSESQGYTRAKNDNLLDDLITITSRDCGIWQINIPDESIGSNYEEMLYDPIFCTEQAWNKYQAWIKRGWDERWNAWYGYKNGYAIDPSWWRWSIKNEEWRQTGRYIHRAIRGVSNYYGRTFHTTQPLLDYYSVPDKPEATIPSSAIFYASRDEVEAPWHEELVLPD